MLTQFLLISLLFILPGCQACLVPTLCIIKENLATLNNSHALYVCFGGIGTHSKSYQCNDTPVYCNTVIIRNPSRITTASLNCSSTTMIL
ncbi:hypothetical protein F4801DRAFT_536636 [Xylaria longipes]|nr:hypothetical protein F4801DRAFT_536636 [Xylaria longipes]